MAVLARLKIAPNQRLDLPDILAFDAYAAGDWKYFLNTLTGGRAVIVKGFEIYEPNTLIGNPAGNVGIVIADSSLWWPNGSEGSFYASLATEANRSITLITNTTNYIEMTLTLSSKAEDARALWDPGANGGAGGEFTQVIDTEYYLDIEISRNNTGFSADKIPLAKIVVNSFNNVESITDSRPLLFRLGSGGTNPDPVNSFSWEDDPLGFSRTDTAVTMTSPTEENVFRGADKNITNLKDWMDAVMTRIKELAGQPKWFAAAPGSPSMPLSLSQLFLDSQSGHSIQPDRDVSFTWSKNSDGKFRSENAVGANKQVTWKSTFGQLSWNLGGSFVSLTNREYSDFTFEKFVSPDENLYISLQRDAIINGDPVVTFENISGSTAYVSAASTGAFTGVAVGDYLRKASSTLDQYYRVQELRVNAGTPFTNGTFEGTVANATVQYVVLTTHDGPISKTTEKFKYFRSRYQASDLFTDDIGQLNPNYYWLGRRNGDMFYLRDYGDMQPGEEVESLNDSETQEHGGSSDLILERANDSVYDPANGYSLKSGGGGGGGGLIDLIDTNWYVTYGDEAEVFSSGVCNNIGQTFTLNQAVDIQYVRVFMGTPVVPSSGSVVVDLYATSAGVPSGTPIATSSPVSVTSGFGDWVNFEFAPLVPLLAGVKYAFIIRTVGVTDGTVITFSAVNAYGGVDYSGGDYFYNSNILTAKDMAFSLQGILSVSGGTLLTIRRRLLDNTIGTPSGVDNSDASLTYVINAPIGTIPNSFGLWVRLGNSSGTLSSGDVTNVATDNVWEIRDPIDNPLRTYDNRNVYLIARKFTINSVECLIFSDGTMMSYDGQWVNNHLSVQSDLFLKSKTQWSVPFIGTTGGRVDENNAEFFWNNVSGNDSLGVLGVRNLRITEDTANNRDVIDQDVAQDHYFLPNLGSKTIRFGNSNSTVYIPGDLVVDGNSAAINTVILQSDDKIISMGVGNLNDGGYGSGLEVADNTKNALQIDSVSGQTYVDVTYSSAHAYMVGDELNVDSNVACGGITAGQMNGSYIVVASASSPGDAQVLSSTSLRIYTNGSATSSASVSLSPPTTQVRTYVAPWSVRLGTSAGGYTGITSWVFRVKNQATTPTLTPVSSYGIVPTAHSSNMQAMRIPFVNDDNVGPSGADTTINFTGNLTWNNSTTTLTVGGDVVPMTDNYYDIGKYNLRWKTLHVGPGSIVVHNDITDVNKITLGFTGSTATLISNSATPINIAVNGQSGVNFDIGGRLGVFGATDSSIALNVASASPITSGTTQTGMYLNMPLSGSAASENLKLRLSTTVATGSATNLRLMNTVASSSLSSQYGLYIDDLGSATFNYGIHSNVSSASNNWNLYIAGSAQNYFAGNVGVGITAPGAKLNVVDSGTQDAVRITQTGTGNALVVEDSANIDATPFVVDASGNLIAGHTSYITASNSSIAKLATVNGLVGIAQYSANSSGQALEFLKSRSSSLNVHAAVQSGDQLGIALFSGSDGSSFVRSASIEAAADATVNASEVPGRLVFSTASVAAPGSPVSYSSNLTYYGASTVSSNGYGSLFVAPTSGTIQSFTFYPSQSGASGTVQAELWSTSGGVASALLATSSSVNVNTLPSLFSHVAVVFTFASPPSISSGTTYMGVIRFVGASGTIFLENASSVGTLWSTAASYVGTGSAAPTVFNGSNALTASMSVAASSASVLTERMRITSTGNVGIGITNPTAKLNIVDSGTQDAVRITQTGTGNALVVEDSANPDITPFLIDQNGRVGIGNTPYTDAVSLTIDRTVSGSSLGAGLYNRGTIGSDVTGTFYSYASDYATQSASFNLNYFIHYAVYRGYATSPSTVQNQYGFYVDAAMDGAVRNYGVYSAINASTNNWNFYAGSSAKNYFGGSVGIATANPTSLFSVGASSEFQVDSSGNAVKIRNVAYSWPSAQGAANTSLINDGSGNLSWSNAAYWAYKSSTVTTNYSVQTSDMVIPISTTANVSDITMTLPTASSVGIGKVYIFKDVGGQCSQAGKRIIIARSGSDTIDGGTTLTMENDYVSFTLVSSGSAWSVV